MTSNHLVVGSNPTVCTIGIMKHCPKCNLNKPIKEFYIRRGEQTHSYCKKCVNEQTLNRQRNLKAEAVKYKGSVCTVCNGVFHPAAYDFHHPDPTQKDYSLGNKKNLKLEAHITELDKCVLVCSNCHRTLHAKH